MLTFIGVLATVLFGVVAVWLVVRPPQLGEISLVRRKCFVLFDGSADTLGLLNVTFNNQPVQKGTALLRGYLLNSGRKDIEPQMVATPPSLRLPEGYRWLHAAACPSSPEIELRVRLNDRELTFELGLFRQNEYLQFEALAQTPDIGEGFNEGQSLAEKFGQAVKLSHRIADTRAAVDLDLEDTAAGYMKRALLLCAATAGAFISGMYLESTIPGLYTIVWFAVIVVAALIVFLFLVVWRDRRLLSKFTNGIRWSELHESTQTVSSR